MYVTLLSIGNTQINIGNTQINIGNTQTYCFCVSCAYLLSLWLRSVNTFCLNQKSLGEPRTRTRVSIAPGFLVQHAISKSDLISFLHLILRACVLLYRLWVRGETDRWNSVSWQEETERVIRIKLGWRRQSSGAVWKSRWPSWAFRPNEPYGFCGRKATLVTICPHYVNRHPRTWSATSSSSS